MLQTDLLMEERVIQSFTQERVLLLKNNIVQVEAKVLCDKTTQDVAYSYLKE